MGKKEPVIFKCEDSLWQRLADGTKTWDARRHDISDERIYRLSRGKFDRESRLDRQPFYSLEEIFIHFENEQTGAILQFRYRGMEFVPWAPGWCFLQLGGLVSRSVSPESRGD